MTRIFRILMVFLVVITGLAVHLRNDQSITFDYYLGSVDLPFSFFLVTALVSGAVLGMIACLPMLLYLKKENRALKSRLRISEKELDNLRIIPTRN
jgi:putative membrane protein